jgi:hypothetical protein
MIRPRPRRSARPPKSPHARGGSPPRACDSPVTSAGADPNTVRNDWQSAWNIHCSTASEASKVQPVASLNRLSPWHHGLDHLQAPICLLLGGAFRARSHRPGFFSPQSWSAGTLTRTPIASPGCRAHAGTLHCGPSRRDPLIRSALGHLGTECSNTGTHHVVCRIDLAG